MTRPLAKLRLQLRADEVIVAESADTDLWLRALREIIERDRAAAASMEAAVTTALEPTS